MEYTLEQRAEQIIAFCLQQKSCDPVFIFEQAAREDFVRMHGPEHHVLDGAALLTACYNAGWPFDLAASLAELMRRGLQMPGAACGMWASVVQSVRWARRCPSWMEPARLQRMRRGASICCLPPAHWGGLPQWEAPAAVSGMPFWPLRKRSITCGKKLQFR